MQKRQVVWSVCLGAVAATLLVAATVIGYEDFSIITTPANPASGFLRIWGDNSTGLFKCVTSAGATCYFDASGGPPGGAAGGDLTGTYPNPGVGQVNGLAIPASAGLTGTNSSRQFVSASAANVYGLFSGSCSSVTYLSGSGACSTPSGGTPGGAAGGDLTGTYPNPGVGQVNGAAVPVSAALLSSNASRQLIAAAATTIASISYVAGGGSANLQTASYTPANTSLVTGLALCWLPTAANSTTTPTFAPDGLTAHVIVKSGGSALAASDLTTTALACAIYNSTGTHWELQNPQTGLAGTGTVTSVICGTGMTGGTITISGTCNVASSLPSTTSVNGTTIPSSSTLAVIVASGSKAMGTSAIASGACATVVTDTATGATAATDSLSADFSIDPTSTTGYSASALGMLTIIKYITTNTVNFKVCNNTGASITPGAVTLIYRVIR